MRYHKYEKIEEANHKDYFARLESLIKENKKNGWRLCEHYGDVSDKYKARLTFERVIYGYDWA